MGLAVWVTVQNGAKSSSPCTFVQNYLTFSLDEGLGLLVVDLLSSIASPNTKKVLQYKIELAVDNLICCSQSTI